MQALLQAVECDLVMAVRRHRNHRGVSFAEYGAVVGKRGDAKRLRAGEIAVHHGDELHARKARELLGVIAPHVAGADDRGSQ